MAKKPPKSTDDFSRSVVTPLRGIRLASGLSQAKVAEALGISRLQYQRLEHGLVDPRLKLAKRISDLFHCSLEDLLDG